MTKAKCDAGIRPLDARDGAGALPLSAVRAGLDPAQDVERGVEIEAAHNAPGVAGAAADAGRLIGGR